MAINRISLTSQPISENREVAIEIRYAEPPVGVPLVPSETPNKLIGYYDGSFDVVRLYIVDDAGLFLLAL